MVAIDPTDIFDPTKIKYGGASRDYQICPRCKKSIDSHGIPWIAPSEVTNGLVCTLQKLLTDMQKYGRLHGYELPRASVMVGAAYVRFRKSSPGKYVTCSGREGDALDAFTAIKCTLGGDVVFSKTPDTLYGIDGETFPDPVVNDELRPRHNIPKLTYTIRSCAAQKLLTQIFIDAKKSGGVRGIEMTEIMWRASAHDRRTRVESRIWSTGHVVPPCDTCRQVLPQMLCDQHE